MKSNVPDIDITEKSIPQTLAVGINGKHGCAFGIGVMTTADEVVDSKPGPIAKSCGMDEIDWVAVFGTMASSVHVFKKIPAERSTSHPSQDALIHSFRMKQAVGSNDRMLGEEQ